ncbi:hypothetical protein AVEN_127949-1 [Araneus ventricosus]|uniref:Uncharacterized protein n=1 Tax=Araneus ventricosus TaxID=182803 RepID=A0A4Y2A0Z4_ARAVE|nr:hypothetical protein AVEN_127949-1 [Araneus ventricosus]
MRERVDAVSITMLTLSSKVCDIDKCTKFEVFGKVEMCPDTNKCQRTGPEASVEGFCLSLAVFSLPFVTCDEITEFPVHWKTELFVIGKSQVNCGCLKGHNCVQWYALGIPSLAQILHWRRR